MTVCGKQTPENHISNSASVCAYPHPGRITPVCTLARNSVSKSKRGTSGLTSGTFMPTCCNNFSSSLHLIGIKKTHAAEHRFHRRAPAVVLSAYATVNYQQRSRQNIGYLPLRRGAQSRDIRSAESHPLFLVPYLGYRYPVPPH